MKKVCFLIGNINNSGGTERVTSLISNELSKQQYSISILNMVDGKKPFFELHSDIESYTLNKGKVSFKKNFIVTVWKIRKFVKRNDINTVIVVDSISCIFTVLALYKLNIKHICWEHFSFNDNNGNKLRGIGRKLAANYCDYIVTLTKSDKKIWEQNLKDIKANIISISNPSPYENMQHTPSLDFKVILAVGRLTKVKGFDLLIEAWGQVCRQNHDWTLRIVGSGEEEKNLKEQASVLGISDRISFIPATKNVEMYYRSSSFYCMSSRHEGFGMVIVEAQSFGLPVISFDCEVGPSEIINNKINGWLVPPQNIESMKDTIIYAINILDEEYQSFVKNSYINSELFAIKEIANEWKNVI